LQELISAKVGACGVWSIGLLLGVTAHDNRVPSYWQSSNSKHPKRSSSLTGTTLATHHGVEILKYERHAGSRRTHLIASIPSQSQTRRIQDPVSPDNMLSCSCTVVLG
jgi:hypothetical protein